MVAFQTRRPDARPQHRCATRSTSPPREPGLMTPAALGPRDQARVMDAVSRIPSSPLRDPAQVNPARPRGRG
jgi:hypothetical protein